MCEILAFRSERPFRLGELLGTSERLEAWGDTGHGWGVAWVEPGSDRVCIHKQPTALQADPHAFRAVGDKFATTAFLHLRAPSDPTTVAMPDTQPFLNPSGFAFAHNGYLPRHNELRPRFEGRSIGRADSEIGSLLYQDLIPALGPVEALPALHRELGGERANLIALFPGGRLLAYASHVGNLLYSLRDADRDVLVTSMHLLDDSLVRKLYPGAQGPRRLSFGEIVDWAAVAEPATASAR